MESKTATCKLCQKERDLKKSHIVPDFMYKPLFDEKHRFYQVPGDFNKKYKIHQTGIYERLLCLECEGHLNKYETYASLAFKGGQGITGSAQGRVLNVCNIDYAKFKLFSLSILWRAAVASNNIFDQVKLGLHEEKLRTMILNGAPGAEDEYPFVLSPIIHKKEVQNELIPKPTCTRLEGHYVYRLVFGGILWVFLVSSHKAPKEFINASINKKGELTMIYQELADQEFIINMAKELQQRGKL